MIAPISKPASDRFQLWKMISGFCEADAKKDYRSCSPAPELKQGTWVWPDVPIPTILSFSHLEVLDLGKDSASWTLSPEDVKSFWPLLQLKMLVTC